jgi:excisionase family DNA binding protein
MTLGVENTHDSHIERQTLTVEEAARVLGIGRSAAYLAARRGDLPVIRIGRRYVVPRLALERMLDREHSSGDSYR